MKKRFRKTAHTPHRDRMLVSFPSVETGAQAAIFWLTIAADYDRACAWLDLILGQGFAPVGLTDRFRLAVVSHDGRNFSMCGQHWCALHAMTTDIATEFPAAPAASAGGPLPLQPLLARAGQGAACGPSVTSETALVIGGKSLTVIHNDFDHLGEVWLAEFLTNALPR